MDGAVLGWAVIYRSLPEHTDEQWKPSRETSKIMLREKGRNPLLSGSGTCGIALGEVAFARDLLVFVLGI
jgi:hypothetical protein